MADFDWANLPPDLVRSFAGALSDGRPDTDQALELLRAEVPVPDADFFHHYNVRWVAARQWLAEDLAALDYVYGSLQGSVIPASSRGRVLSHRRKHAAVKAVVDPHGGRRQSKATREALVQALLAAGGSFVSQGESQKLNRFNVVPTRGTALPLYPHQQRVVEALRQMYRDRGNEMVGVVVMPTGSGKTVTAVQWLLDDPVRRGTKVLWITHRQELLNQTASVFVQSAPVLADGRDRFTLRLIGGGHGPASTIADSGHDVVVATMGALSYDMRAVKSFLTAHPCVVVFDEAHHCVAPTWRAILELAREVTDDAVLGLTATPTRMGEAERRLLGRLLETTIAQVSLGELVAGNYLAEARCQSVSTDLHVEKDLANAADLSYLAQYGELSPRLASALAENVPRNQIIVDTYKRGPADGKEKRYEQTVVFAVTVDHAHTLAKDFARSGIMAGALTASWSAVYKPGTPKVVAEDVDRENLLARFRDGGLPVLVNVAVLTEGVDVPKAKTAFLARPTGSEVLMSQMVGRALRGEKVGGTSSAYLVSFRDHWDQFQDWMDPIQLPGLVEAPVEEYVEEPSTAAAGAFKGISEAEWRRILEGAASEVSEHIRASVGSTWSRTPVGLYMFETELPIEAPAGEEDIDTRSVHLWVYEHDQGGFDALTAAVLDGSAGVDAGHWAEAFFGQTPEPRPALSRLELLSRYVATDGSMPDFIALGRRDETDPAKVARRLFTADARRAERDTAIRKAYEANPALVDAFYGGEHGLRQQVLERLFRLEAGLPNSFDELEVPRVRAGDRFDHTFGEGAHDLKQILEKVRTDTDLFPDGLRSPVGGIEWTSDPFRSAWADYSWRDETGGQRDERVRVNVLLDSNAVSSEVIEFLVYHELLHHQDVLTEREGSPHDRDFREREARHPAIVQANAWIDTFVDRVAPINKDGRPVPA